MDTRLFKAALTGNTKLLHELLRENPLILNKTSLFSTQNPLHIVSISGHVEFAKEILRLKPEFAYELDQDGFSPLHMAAATGCVEIVKELMGIDPMLCRIEGREKKTPLHVAAIKGKVGVVKEMILNCVECAEDVNVRGETALHLAVKNNQFEAVRVMVELLREMKRNHVLNMKDEGGNTILHLAAWRKEFQVIELLLTNGTADTGQLEVNAINESGLTALDLQMMFPSEAGDREIVEIMRNAGAVRAKDISQSAISSFRSSTAQQQQQRDQQQQDDSVEYFKFDRGRDSPSEARSTLLVVASLVAIATFQSGLTPPGGTWQDSYFPSETNSNTTSDHKIHKAGRSIMGTHNGVAFVLFVLFNSIGFSVSLSMISILTTKFPLQLELQICLVSMYFSYNTAMQVVAPDNLELYCTLITSILPAITSLLMMFLKISTCKLVEFVKPIIRKVFNLMKDCTAQHCSSS